MTGEFTVRCIRPGVNLPLPLRSYQSLHAVPLACGRAAVPRRRSAGDLEQLGYRSRRTGVQAVLLQVCGPRSQVIRECRICIRVPVIQVAAILPEGRVGSERIPQCDRDRSAHLAFIWICFQFGEDSGKPVRKMITVQPRISCGGALGVRVVIGCESGSVGDGLRWVRFPELSQTMQHEQRGELAEALFEPSVLVPACGDRSWS